MQVFSIRDAKAGVYNQPFYSHTPEEAMRHLAKATRDPQTMINMFPEDYDLYHLGQYDDREGVIQPFDTPKHIAKAIHLKGDSLSPA